MAHSELLAFMPHSLSFWLVGHSRNQVERTSKFHLFKLLIFRKTSTRLFGQLKRIISQHNLRILLSVFWTKCSRKLFFLQATALVSLSKRNGLNQNA